MTNPTHRLKTIALAAVTALLVGACASAGAPGEDASDRARADKGDKVSQEGGKKGKGKGKAGKQGRRAGDETLAQGRGGRAGANKGSGGAAGAGGGKGSGGGIDPAAATGTSVVEEPNPDAQKEGLPPDYAEVYRASVTGTGDALRLTAVFGGTVPSRMPDKDTFMVLGWGLSNPRDRQQSWSFGAQATNEGWTPYAGRSGEKPKSGQSPSFPGQFAVDGNEIRMVIPWSYFGGPRRLKWQANMGWFRQIAQTSHFAFDPIPNEGPARYPQ